MKVLDLRCDHDHAFEGWFASEDDFQQQLQRKLVECPLCGSQAVRRLPSAPRLNLSGAREPQPRPKPELAQAGTATPATRTPAPGEPGLAPAALQALWMQAVAQVLQNTEDVGERFAEEARRIHYGESEDRGIRGQASAEEREALADEGIEVFALPIPAALKGGPAH